MTASARKNLCAAAAPLGVLTFWCGLWMAARRYPSEYDWRFITISRLGYADRNPDGYRWAWGGLMVCGLGGLCWTAVLLRDWRRDGTGRRPVGIWALALGYVCMVGCASLPGGFPLLPRGHDFLAVTAFFGVCIGIMQMSPSQSTVLRRPASRPSGVANSNRCRYAGVHLACAAGTAVGRPRMACTGCARLLELRSLAMDHLRRFFRVLRDPVSDDDDALASLRTGAVSSESKSLRAYLPLSV